MSVVDCRGLACPQPVMMTKRTLDQLGEGDLIVIVDNAFSCNNVERRVSNMVDIAQSLLEADRLIRP